MNIGITIGRSEDKIKINAAYVDYVINAGYNPIILPVGSNHESMVDICDAILLTGGIDLEPTYYGENNLASNYVDIERDEFERNVLYEAIAANKKVFGICRGFQLIVREFMRIHENAIPSSVSFYQHINDHSLASSRSIPRSVPSHSVIYNAKKLYGIDDDKNSSMFVNSMHHQALTMHDNALAITVGEDKLVSLAITTFGKPSKNKKEVIVEAVDVTLMGGTLRGVQWHPEELNDVALLQHFLEHNGEEETLVIGV